MYTLVFKWKDDDTMVVFDVYYTKSGKQRVIGNIFCWRKPGKYATTCMMEDAFWNLPDSSKTIQQLETKASDTCYSWLNI